MKKYLIAVMLGAMVCVANCFAQDSTRALNKNAVMFEAGGNGAILSISYERMFYQKDNLRLCARAGVGILPHIGERNFHLEDHLFPFVEATLLSGKRKGYFETGIGFTFNPIKRHVHEIQEDGTWETVSYRENDFFLRIGYRYQGMKGFLFRVAATPIIFYERDHILEPGDKRGEWTIFPWAGLSFGYSF